MFHPVVDDRVLDRLRNRGRIIGGFDKAFHFDVLANPIGSIPNILLSQFQLRRCPLFRLGGLVGVGGGFLDSFYLCMLYNLAQHKGLLR